MDLRLCSPPIRRVLLLGQSGRGALKGFVCLGVEQDRTFGDDWVAGGKARQDPNVLTVLLAGPHFALGEGPVGVLREHEELVERANSAASGASERHQIRKALYLHVREHAGPQARVWIGNFDPRYGNARDGVDGVAHVGDVSH